MTPPERVGKYELISKIADGGMAEVFLAVVGGVGGFQKRVALKLILPNFTRDATFVQGFVNEARICGQLQHPNLVQVYEFQQIEDRYYLAMEFIEGLDMERIISHRYMQREPIPPPVAIEIVCQMLEGLEYAHTASDMDNKPLNIVHRDLKPSNILVDLNGVIKIVDFGVAKSSTNLYKTMNVGTAKGTVSYMSPEQAAGRTDLGPPSDLFSVGEILYELLTLDRLFDGDNLFAILDEVRTAPLESRLAALNHLPPQLVAILEKALERDLGKRYSSCAAMLKDLRGVYPDRQGQSILVRFVESLRGDGLKIAGLEEEYELTPPGGVSWSMKLASASVEPDLADLAQTGKPPAANEESQRGSNSISGLPHEQLAVPLGDQAEERSEVSNAPVDSSEVVPTSRDYPDLSESTEWGNRPRKRGQPKTIDFEQSDIPAPSISPQDLDVLGEDTVSENQPSAITGGAPLRFDSPAPQAEADDFAGSGLETGEGSISSIVRAPEAAPRPFATDPEQPLSPAQPIQKQAPPPNSIKQPTPPSEAAESSAPPPAQKPPPAYSTQQPPSPVERVLPRSEVADEAEGPPEGTSRSSRRAQQWSVADTRQLEWANSQRRAEAPTQALPVGQVPSKEAPEAEMAPKGSPVSGEAHMLPDAPYVPGEVATPPGASSKSPDQSSPPKRLPDIPYVPKRQPESASPQARLPDDPYEHGNEGPSAGRLPDIPYTHETQGFPPPIEGPQSSDATGGFSEGWTGSGSFEAPAWAQDDIESGPDWSDGEYEDEEPASQSLPDPLSDQQVESLFEKDSEWRQEAERPFGAQLARVNPEPRIPPEVVRKRRERIVRRLASLSLTLLLLLGAAAFWTVMGFKPTLSSLVFPPKPVEVTITITNKPAWGEARFFGDPPVKANEEGKFTVTLDRKKAYVVKIEGARSESIESPTVVIDPADPQTWTIKHTFTRRGKLR